MAIIEEKWLYCKRCKKETLAKRKKTNHIFHIIISLITLGLWIPFWIMAILQFNSWHCDVCGTRVKDNKIKKEIK